MKVINLGWIIFGFCSSWGNMPKSRGHSIWDLSCQKCSEMDLCGVIALIASYYYTVVVRKKKKKKGGGLWGTNQ